MEKMVIVAWIGDLPVRITDNGYYAILIIILVGGIINWRRS